MKKGLLIITVVLMSIASRATIHIVRVWEGYFQFTSADITIQLGDTVQWLPLDYPTMVHTITSTNIPSGAAAFDQIWQAPADTFFQYVPLVAGLYEYECTPHATSFNMVGTITVVDSATSTDDIDLSDLDIKVYPNPARDFIELTNTNTSFNYCLYDIGGRIVGSGKIDGPIDISSLINGTYFVEITGDKPRVLKFVKY